MNHINYCQTFEIRYSVQTYSAILNRTTIALAGPLGLTYQIVYILKVELIE